MRRERDRHIDALLSGGFAGRRSPILESDASNSAAEDNVTEQSDDSSNAFLRIKNRVNKGITELLNKGSPPRSTSPLTGNVQRGRTLGSDTARSLPSSPLIGRTLRSRSPSPNPWETVTTGGTSMIRGGSATAAYNNRNSKNDAHNNIFDGI